MVDTVFAVSTSSHLAQPRTVPGSHRSRKPATEPPISKSVKIKPKFRNLITEVPIFNTRKHPPPTPSRGVLTQWPSISIAARHLCIDFPFCATLRKSCYLVEASLRLVLLLLLLSLCWCVTPSGTQSSRLAMAGWLLVLVRLPLCRNVGHDPFGVCLFKNFIFPNKSAALAKARTEDGTAVVGCSVNFEWRGLNLDFQWIPLLFRCRLLPRHLLVHLGSRGVFSSKMMFRFPLFFILLKGNWNK